LGAIVNPPNNALVVPFEGTHAYLTCESDKKDEIAWTYDGNTVIHAPCEPAKVTPPVIFTAFTGKNTSTQCNVNASLDEARLDSSIQTISGPYGCTDRSNRGITETAMVIVLGKLIFVCVPYKYP